MADLRIAVTLVLALQFPVFSTGQLQTILATGTTVHLFYCLTTLFDAGRL